MDGCVGVKREVYVSTNYGKKITKRGKMKEKERESEWRSEQRETIRTIWMKWNCDFFLYFPLHTTTTPTYSLLTRHKLTHSYDGYDAVHHFLVHGIIECLLLYGKDQPCRNHTMDLDRRWTVLDPIDLRYEIPTKSDRRFVPSLFRQQGGYLFLWRFGKNVSVNMDVYCIWPEPRTHYEPIRPSTIHERMYLLEHRPFPRRVTSVPITETFSKPVPWTSAPVHCRYVYSNRRVHVPPTS